MFLALRDLLFAKGRFLLMAAVIVMVALMMVLLTGLSSGLVDRNISGIRALPITHLAFEYDDKPTWSNSMVERAMWEGWADRTGVMAATQLGNTMFNARTSKGEPVTLALWGMDPGSFIDPGADIGRPIGDDPLIAGILSDHALEISTDPANEALFLVAHGPEDDFDNELDLPVIESLAEQVQAATGISEVRAINLQDDAIPPVREGNVRQLKRWMRQAQRKGKKLIVVSPASSADGLQHHIRQDLIGLDYTFNEKGLSQHPKFTEWVVNTVRQQVAGL